MTDRLLLVLAGLLGLAIFWLLDHEDRRRSEGSGRSFKDRLVQAWVSGDPVGGSLALGWLLVASVGLILVGLFRFDG